MSRFWKALARRTRDGLVDRLNRLNLEIMGAVLEEDRQRVRDLRRQRSEIQEALFTGQDRRRTTTAFA